MIDTYKMYEEMKGDHVLLSYKGEVSFDMVKSLLDILEARLNREEKDPKTKKKVFNILVECLQNLSHHVDLSKGDIKKVPERRNAVILLWFEKGAYQVATGNYIRNENIAKLKTWLERINGLPKEGLRDLYKSVLDNNTFSSKGGGGLGFIDIARKSGEKLVYNFDHVDEADSFFSFSIQIPKG